jgi:predicted DNA-binding transcriptional regulator YafY
MRGDRLLKLLLLLQSRGKMRVETLAEELEVSERTVYRDLIALDTAGVPVVTERGPGGGCSLMDGYTTRLTGLTEEEGTALAVALFAGGMPRGPADLGMGEAYDSARLKLSASLPARLRRGESAARNRVLIDSGDADARPLSVLSIAHDALMRGIALKVVQALPYGPVAGLTLERRVEPYGLVAADSGWRLVGRSDGRIRCFRVTELLRASAIEGDAVEIPNGFDLGGFWREARAEEYRLSRSFKARLRLDPAAADALAAYFGRGMADLVEATASRGRDGRAEIELGFAAAEEAVVLLPLLGAAAEVIGPGFLREAVADRARAMLEVYGKPGSG